MLATLISIFMALSPFMGVTAPSPFSNSVFPAQTFTTTGQTGATIQLNGVTNTSTVGSSFNVGTVTLTGTSLTTVTFAVYGSADNGATFYPLPISTLAVPGGTPAATVTATAAGLYQVGLASITHVKFITSGTFTATAVSLTLTATPNGGGNGLSGGNGGGGSNTLPATSVVYKGTGVAGIATPGTPGTDYVAPALTSLQSLQGPITTPSNNQEIYAPFYATPALAVAAACAASSKEVYFPAGIYPMTTGMQACSGLHIRCAASSLVAANSGAVFQLQSGAAIWGLYNPNANAQVTPGAGAINGMYVDDCSFDISLDSAALGAIQQKGIDSSSFRGNSFFSNHNPNPVVTMDGGNFAYNSGDYDNTWVGNNFYDSVTGGTDVAVLMTNTQTTGGSNNNTIVGGSISRYGTPVEIDAGNNNSVIGVDLENFAVYGTYLTHNVAVGGTATQNHFEYDRYEALTGSPTGIQIDATATGNTITHPYFSGAFTYFNDANSVANNICEGCFVNAINSTVLTGLTTGNPFHNVGIGSLPNCLDGFQFNCLFVLGEMSANRNFTLGSTHGGYTDQYSNATAHREVFWPDQGGPVLVGGAVIPLLPSSTAVPGTNVSSAFLQFTSSYYSGSVTSGGYVSGITATGTIGQTCTLSSFNNSSTATGTVALTGTNTIASGTSLVITSGGTGATAPPTSATASNGTATCTGTATITTVAASQDTYQCRSLPGSGTNPAVNLICSLTGTGGVASPGAHNAIMENFNWIFFNTLAATSGANQAAPTHQFFGNMWNGSASISDTWTETPTMGTGANAASYINWVHSGSSGPAYVQFPALSINGSNSPVTSTSSTGTQVVTCAPGGTTTQVCGADGNWHNAAVVPGGLPSGCNQAPCQVATVASTTNSSITSSTSFTTFYTTTQAGMYQLCSYSHITVAGTVSGSGTISTYGKYTTDGVTLTPQIGIAVAAQTLGAVNSSSSPPNCSMLYVDTATTVQWGLIVTGTITGAPTIRYGFDLFYMGS